MSKGPADRIALLKAAARFWLIVLGSAALMLGAYVWFAILLQNADRHSIRNAYIKGRLTRERAIELLGPDGEVPEQVTPENRISN